MSQLYPGIHLMVVKGERNAREGEYLLVYDIQSMNVRDGYRHSSGVQTAASETIWEKCGQACSDPGDKFDSMAEVTNWADYVEIARD
ncbi:MAG: hypothetical protein OER90_13655 [Gemmatimonadota bacterium]|nr:hypothetical protein [Gemmatimonadota bacterium]